MIPNKKHQIFADEFKLTNGLTEDAIRCYQIAYPNTQKESARVKSSKLLQDVTIKNYIQEYKENIRLERENNSLNQLKKQDNTNILQREKVLEMASNVVKLAYNQVAVSKGGDKAVYAFSSAVQILNKMQGFDAPSKTELDINSKELIIKGKKFAKGDK